jgi:hypothetical protein
MLRSPGENPAEEMSANPPPYVTARRRLITSAPGFWRNLQPLTLGFRILGLLMDLEFNTHIVTKGPADHALAWMEKLEWCRRYVPGLPVVITEDKALVSGTVLVEDWPPYIARWLERSPQGLVLVPARSWNGDVESTFGNRCVRCDLKNLNFVRERLVHVRAAAEAGR